MKHRLFDRAPNTFLSSDGLNIAYYIDDSTPPWSCPDTLLLLHPAMGSAKRYFEWIPPLCGRYRVLRMDMRGHGATDIPALESPLTMDRLVQDVTELLDHVGCDRAHIVGASAGGYIGQNLAMSRPDRIRSLMLFSSTPGLGQSQWSEWLPTVEKIGMRGLMSQNLGARLPVAQMDPAHVDWFLNEADRLNVPFAARFVTLMSSLNWVDRLTEIRCPTLIVRPGLIDSGLGAQEQYETMQEKIPECQLVVYEGLPHHIADAAAQRCVDDVLAFLRRHFGAPGASAGTHA